MRNFSLIAALILSFAIANISYASSWDQLVIPRLKYSGGGDWYSDPTSMLNLMKQARKRLNIPATTEDVVVSISDTDLFKYPMIYMSGHGKVKFKDFELNRLRTYLDNGGFLWASDDYGLDKYIRQEMKRLYPDKELVLLSKEHPIFHGAYDMPEGLPKVHEHDGKPPQAYAIFDKGRMTFLYTHECDIGDGIADEGVHQGDSPEIREKAMKTALNILSFVMTQ